MYDEISHRLVIKCRNLTSIVLATRGRNTYRQHIITFGERSTCLYRQRNLQISGILSALHFSRRNLKSLDSSIGQSCILGRVLLIVFCHQRHVGSATNLYSLLCRILHAHMYIGQGIATQSYRSLVNRAFCNIRLIRVNENAVGLLAIHVVRFVLATACEGCCTKQHCPTE